MRTLGNLTMTMAVIAAMIPSIIRMMLIIMVQSQLAFSIPRVQKNNEPVEFVVQEDKPKKKKMQVGHENSLDTALGITNFYEFDPLIPKESL